MRIPKQSSQTSAEPAQPAAVPAAPAPAAPPSAAPASGEKPEGQAAFLSALAEEAARDQRQAAAAQAARANAEAELVPLADAPAGEPGYAVTKGPVPPAAPSPVAPARGGMPEDRDALFKVLAEEAAREQSQTAAAMAAKTGAEADRAPSPEALVRGQSAAAKELRIKTADDKAGYSIVQESAPTPPAGHDKRPQIMRKLVGAAAGLLVLIVVITAISIGFSSSSSKKPRAIAQPIPVVQPAPTPEVTPPPAFPAVLKEAAQALAAKTPVEVEVVVASADAAAQPMAVLTPTGDLMLDATNVHIRDKTAGDASIEEIRSASRAAIYASVAAKLREKGLAPAEAEPSAAGSPGELRSRLKVFISTAPAWERFNFTEGGTPVPVMQGRSGRPPAPNFMRRGGRALSGGAAFVPPTPVKLWEKLVSSGLTLDALFLPSIAATWGAVSTDDAHADPVPCGVRISIVRVAWEVGGQTHELIGLPAEADTTLSGKEAEAGAALPFHRPKELREIQLTGQMGPDRICLLSGFCQYDDADLRGDAAEAGKLAAGLLVAPEADWQTFWDGKADRNSIAAACRNILRLGGGPAIVETMTATPDRLPRLSADALVAVLKEERSCPEWVSPFLPLHGPCGDAALICLARQAKEENENDFLQWVAKPADHSPESVQAACCALIELGRPGPEVNALIDTHAVQAFPEVRSPRGSLLFPPQTTQTVLAWLIRSGTASQRTGAAVAVVTGGNVRELQDEVRAFVSQSLGSDPETLGRLCKGIEKEQSPLAFQILSSMAREFIQSDVGDRFPPAAALADAGAPLPTERFSRTLAAQVCAGLARFDKFEAGKVLVGLLQSPGPATRYCAIETLIALDDVDASKEIRARFDALSRQARNAYEMQEWDLVNPVKNKLCRYDVPMISAENALKSGGRAKEVIEICDGIIKENPSPTLVERARDMKRQAEKLLQPRAGAPR
jgi:hypothetical protein